MTTQTTTPKVAGAVTQETGLPYAPSPLLEEIIEETRLRGRLGVFDLDRAAEQAEQRVKALKILMHAAIGATKPIHWLLFKNKQGQIFARFNASGAERIATVFGITVTPKGQPRIVDNHGQRKTAEVFGTATSAVLGLTIDNIRSYRVEGEDFLGRPAEDTTYGDSKKIIAGVGDNDWLQSTLTGLISKGVRLLSGLITVSPDELAEVWDIPVEKVVSSCTMGHGFSRDERATAGQSAGAGTGVPVSEKQINRLFWLAKDRLAELKLKEPDRERLVTRCINKAMGLPWDHPVAGRPPITRDIYDTICDTIQKWEPEANGDGAKAPATAPDPETTAPQGELATVGQKKMLQDKANAKAKALPAGAGVDGGAILHECVMEVCGSDKGIDDVEQSQLAAVVGKIGAWGAAK